MEFLVFNQKTDCVRSFEPFFHFDVKTKKLKLPPGKYLPMGLSELADHSNSVQHFNEMIQTTFNNNAQRSLATTIPKTFMGARRYQKGVV